MEADSNPSSQRRFAKPSEYMLGTSDEELDRLGHQHQVWLADTTALWREAGFGHGQRLIDLGCGPGFATIDLANLVGPAGHVTAIDSADKYIRHIEAKLTASRLQNVDTLVSDVQSLGLADSSFNGIFVRWLLCFVPQPAKAIVEVFRLLQPGGSLVIMDYFNYQSARIFPERDSFKRMFECFYESAIQNNGSFNIGNHLPKMLLEAGFELRTLRPYIHTAQPGSEIWYWLERFNMVFLPQLVSQGIMQEEEKQAIARDWQEAATEKGTFFFTPPVIGIIAQKPAR